MKVLVTKQRKVGTAKKQKESKHRGMNKDILELEAKVKQQRELLLRALDCLSDLYSDEASLNELEKDLKQALKER